MSDDPRYPPVLNQYWEIRYVTIEGAGGSRRIWMTELPAWLLAHPGTLVVAIRELP
jgi:hypothetical protein